MTSVSSGREARCAIPARLQQVSFRFRRNCVVRRRAQRGGAGIEAWGGVLGGLPWQRQRLQRRLGIAVGMGREGVEEVVVEEGGGAPVCLGGAGVEVDS